MLAYLDCTSGISGDKFVAAIIDAGARAETLQKALDALDIGISLHTEPVTRGTVRGLAVRMDAPKPQPHRMWHDIRALLESAPLDPTVASDAVRVFELIAQAEASVHGCDVDEVHFHEVGAADSIGDIVAACCGIHELGIERLIASPLALGSGTVESQHGTLPVPAPATALLVRGLPIAAGTGSEDEGELTTPTGAALVAGLAHNHGAMPTMTLRAVGHGAGSRETKLPNVARLFLGEAPASLSAAFPVSDAFLTEEIVHLATNIDHLSPEHAAYASQRVLEAGALDAWLTPIVMKKGRPALLFEALATPQTAPHLAECIAEETGSLGVRILPLERIAVRREIVDVATALGTVRLKVAHLPHGPRLRAEYEDCARLAREHHLPISHVAELIEAAAREQLRL